MKSRKIMSLLLCGAMLASMAACGKETKPAETKPAGTQATEAQATEAQATEAQTSGETEAEGETKAEGTGAWYEAVDTSTPVDLVFYVCGDAPEDEVAVEDAINEVLKEKVNATIDMQFSTWTDWSQKYNLTVTTAAADLIYVANWIDYGTLSAAGAFVELDDLMDTYAPDLVEQVPEDTLNMCRSNGELYAIPNTWAEYTSNGITYREDLRAELDLPKPDSIENFEAYMDGIKEAYPDQQLLTVTTEESTGTQVAFDAAWAVLGLQYPWVNVKGLDYGLAADINSPSEVYDYWFSDDFVKDCKILKRWADKGYWSRSALSDTNNSESYKNGLCVAQIAGMNPNKQITAISDFEDAGEGWESEYLAYGEVTGAIYPGHATQKATSIIRGCQNPERALMVLDLLMTDPELNGLIQYGIEGTHYEVDEDGFYKNLSDKFNYEGFNTWNLRNGDIKLAQSTDVKLQEYFDKYAELAEKCKYPGVNIYEGFVEDYSEYSAERTAVSDVMREYLAPLQAGLVDDVDAAVEEFRSKVKAAGLDTVRESYEQQWADYCAEYDYE